MTPVYNCASESLKKLKCLYFRAHTYVLEHMFRYAVLEQKSIEHVLENYSNSITKFYDNIHTYGTYILGFHSCLVNA